MELSRKGFLGAVAMAGAVAGCRSVSPFTDDPAPSVVPHPPVSPHPNVKPPKFKPMQIIGLQPRPAFWKVRPDEIIATCASARLCTRKEVICHTPLGYPVYALFYGRFDEPVPQTSWAAGRASTSYRNYYGKRTDGKQTIVFIAGIHGAEAECVAAAVNLIKMIETGVDFRGKRDPELMRLLENYRLIVVPCVNMDGRAISPDHLRGVDWDQFRRASQGVWKADNSLVGWHGSKAWFPLPLDRVSYPGGYPNADGYNINLDCVPGDIRTEEAKALLKLVARWHADLIINGHSYEFQPSVIAGSGIDYPAGFQRTAEIRYACNMALFKAGLLMRLPKQPQDNDQDSANPYVSLDVAMKNASGALTLCLECSVSYEQPNKPPFSPRRCYSFADLMAPAFIVLKAAMKCGLKRPFVVRGDDTVKPD